MLLIDPSDKLILEPSYRIESTYLVDSILDARHALNPEALEVLNRIDGQALDFATLMHHLSNAGVPQSDVTQFITLLNSISALKVIWNLRKTRQRIISIAQAILVRTPIQFIGYRYRLVFTQLCLAIAAATLPLLGLWIVSLIALLRLGTINMTYFVLTSFSVYVLIFMSLVAHEYGHILILKTSGAKGIISRKGWRVGILHTPVKTHFELISAGIGPLIGGLTAIGLALGANILTGDSLWIKVGMLLGFGHLASLFPGYSDGWTIMQTLRKGRV